ncbi:MAG: (Fe-S)-binding protein [Xanthomonadaceae bacterium]|nr:(Fe-S)-binding protein [Xanthomonadaceae bacterium]
MNANAARPRIGLFVTCLVDLLRPGVGFAAVKLLESAGCIVEVPGGQTCCGQPAYNSGDLSAARALAKQTIQAMESYDYVVLPSGSCAGTLRDYPRLLAVEPVWRQRAQELAERTFELTSFLVDVLGWDAVDAEFPATVTYHDSCAGLRQLGIKQQPRRLLAKVAGLDLRELRETEDCCGFGGTFCVKYPELSTRLADDKIADIEQTGARAVLGGDLGCLLHIAGRLHRRGSPVKAYHVAEVLAGMADQGIGEDKP